MYVARQGTTLREHGGLALLKPFVQSSCNQGECAARDSLEFVQESLADTNRNRLEAASDRGRSAHSHVENRMGARVRTLDLAKRTPEFAAKRVEDPGLRQTINVLATLAIGLLQEVKDLRSAVTKVSTNRFQPVRSLDTCASVLCDHPIDFYKEVERYEIDLIEKALRHAGGSQRRAAQLLNLKATTLNAKLKNYGIDTFGLFVPTAATLASDIEPHAHERVQTAEPQSAPALTNGGRKKASAS